MRAHSSLRLGTLHGTTPELLASPCYCAWGFCMVWEAGLPHKTSSAPPQRRNGRACSSLTARGGGLPVGVSVSEVGLGEVGPPQVGSGKVSHSKVSHAQVGHIEIGVGEVGCSEIGCGEIDLAEVRSCEVSPSEVGVGEVGPAKVWPEYPMLTSPGIPCLDTLL